MKKSLLTIFLIAASFSAHACSVCIARALATALHGLGAQTLPKGKGVIGITVLSFSESNLSDEDDSGGGETQAPPSTTGGGPARDTEGLTQASLDAAYGITNNLMLTASLPYGWRLIRPIGGVGERVDGVGDLTMGLTYQVPPGLKDKVLVAFDAQLKLPTGANNRTNSAGTRFDEHLQPGSGTKDVIFGVLLNLEDPGKPGNVWYGGVHVRRNGVSGHDYHYGDAVFYNLGYGFKLPQFSELAVELNGRISQRNRSGQTSTLTVAAISFMAD